MIDSTLLSVTELACVRGSKTLFRDVSFSVKRGECWHLQGANGSGKSSLLKQLIGLVDHHRGHVVWADQTKTSDKLPDSSMVCTFSLPFAYLGHNDGLKPELSALENLVFYRDFYEADTGLDLDQSLFDVGILTHAEAPVKHLSFGQRRRLSLARLMLSNSQVWLLDEPLTGIDETGRDLFMARFLEHVDSNGAIVLTHHHSLKNSPLAHSLHCLSLHQ